MKYMAQPGAPPAAWQGPLVPRKSSEDEFNNPPRTQKFGHSRGVTNSYQISVSVGSVDSNDRLNQLQQTIQQTVVNITKQTVLDMRRPGNALA